MLTDEEFAAKASCSRSPEPDLFYGPDADEMETATEAQILAGEQMTEARIRYCHGCPVVEECLVRGLDEEWGVWGGLVPDQRRKIREGKQVRLPLRLKSSAKLRSDVALRVKGGQTIREVAFDMDLDRGKVMGAVSDFLMEALKARGTQGPEGGLPMIESGSVDGLRVA